MHKRTASHPNLVNETAWKLEVLTKRMEPLALIKSKQTLMASSDLLVPKKPQSFIELSNTNLFGNSAGNAVLAVERSKSKAFHENVILVKKKQRYIVHKMRNNDGEGIMLK